MTASLRVDTALYASAILLDRLLGLLLLPFLTRAISPQDYGVWTQTAVTAGMLVPLVLFAAPTTIVRYFSGPVGRAGRVRQFGQLGALSVGLFVLCAAAAWLGAAGLAALAYGSAAREPLVPALLALLAADAGVEFAVAWLRAAGRMGRVASVLALRSVLRYGALLVLVGPATPLLDWLGPYAAVQCGFALAVLVLARVLVGAADAAAAATEPPLLRELLRFAFPLVLLAAFTSLNGVLDRFLLVRWIGLDGVAVYAAAVSLCAIPVVFYSVLGFTLFPVLARHWSTRQFDEAARLVSQALRVYLFLCLPVALAIVLAGPWALPLLATADYRAAPGVFAWLGLSVTAFGVYQILIYALLLDGRSHQVLLLAIVATAANLVLNLLLAPRFGASGAAAAAAISNVAMAGLAARLARRVLPWRFPWSGTWAIVWRALAAALPLLAAAQQAAPTPLGMAAGLAASAMLYLGLDRWGSNPVTRAMLPG